MIGKAVEDLMKKYGKKTIAVGKRAATSKRGIKALGARLARLAGFAETKGQKTAIDSLRKRMKDAQARGDMAEYKKIDVEAHKLMRKHDLQDLGKNVATGAVPVLLLDD